MWYFYQENKRALQNLALLCLTILGGFLFFRYLFRIFLPFLLGWLLSLLLNPLAKLLQRLHIPRSIGALIGILLLFALCGLLGFWSGTSLIDMAKSFSDNLPRYIRMLQTGLAQFWAQFDTIAEKLPPQLQESFLEFQNDFTGALLSTLTGLVSAGRLVGVSGFFIGFFVVLLSAYFFTKDQALIRAAYERYVAPLFGSALHATGQELKGSVWGYVKTQLILMCFVFAITLIGMLILRSPRPLLLSVVIAVIDALPFFGSGIILFPGAILFFLRGNVFLALGYLVLYGIIQVMRQLLQPKILSTQIDLHPLLTLFSMYFGLKCLGVFGLILGPIFAVVLKAMFRARQQNEWE